MKKDRVFINADLSINANNAQDRNGKFFSLFLPKKGFEVTAFCKGEIDPRLDTTNIRIVKLRNNKYINTIIQISQLLFCNYNILINQKTTYREYLFFKVRKYLKKRKTISFIVNVYPYENYGTRRTKYSDSIILLSDLVFSNSKFGRETAINHFNQYYNTKLNIKVFNNLYKINDFSKLRKANKDMPLKIVSVGSLQVRKGFTDYLQLASVLDEFDFTWIGDGESRELFERIIKILKLGNVTHLDMVLNSEMVKTLLNFDLFVFPSYTEGFPNVIIEAQQAGLPVITYPFFGPEVIINSHNGYIKKNIVEIIEIIKELNSNRELLERLSKNSFEQVKFFDGDTRISEFINTIMHT